MRIAREPGLRAGTRARAGVDVEGWRAREYGGVYFNARDHRDRRDRRATATATATARGVTMDDDERTCGAQEANG